MNKLLLPICFFCSLLCSAQPDTTKWVRAFPISDYMLDASDSVKIVQLHLPIDSKIADKQIGLLKGVYRESHSDTTIIGSGRCNLIKGDFYYFTINYKKSGRQPKEGDLLYTFMTRTPVYYGNIVRLAGHYIGLLNVYEKPIYDRFAVFSEWSKANEDAAIDSMVADIHFTGEYFLKENPAMNAKITKGKHQGKPVLNAMTSCTRTDVIDFLRYVTMRPNLYAGREWKVSEVFATWMTEGAP